MNPILLSLPPKCLGMMYHHTWIMISLVLVLEDHHQLPFVVKMRSHGAVDAAVTVSEGRDVWEAAVCAHS